MALQEKVLGQLRPANTTAASLYSPGLNVTAIVKTVLIANVGAVDATAQVFLDDDGTTYDESTAIAWNIPVAVGSVVTMDTFVAMNDFNGNLGVRSSVASALNFSAVGAEIT